MKKTSKTLRKSGIVQFSDTVPDGQAVRVARDFLMKLICQVCRQASAYHNKVADDHFLRNPERMMYSQFAAAIHQFTKVHMSEHSIARTSKGLSSSGRVDFWLQYRKTDILLELKRQTFSINLKVGIQSKRISDSLAALVNQSKSLKSEAREWSDKSVLIGLEVLLPYSVRQGEKAAAKAFGGVDRKELCVDFQKDVLRLGSKPNFVATWLPPDSMTKFETNKADQREFNPFIGFVAYIVTIG